jgi:uncharacterized protein DUF2510
VGLSIAGALIGLGSGLAALHALPGRDTAGTALVLLVTTAAGLAAGIVLGGAVDLWRWARRRRASRPADVPVADEPAARLRPEPEPPEPEPEPEWPPPNDPLEPGWHPDPAGGDGQRFWDGQAWTDHRWRPRRPT